MNHIKMKNQGARLFFIELLSAILFFSLICAVCMKIFSDTYALSRKSSNLTQSVNVAANIAEYFNHWDGKMETWNQVFPKGNWMEQGEWCLEYDKDWQPVKSHGKYYVRFHTSESNSMIHAQVTVCEKETKEKSNIIYQLSLERRPYQMKVNQGEGELAYE